MLLRLDEKDRSPKGRQIVDRIQRMIQEGYLKQGESLPSTRRLGEDLGLHRSTIATAYQELWALGWLTLRPGALPRVRTRGELVAPSTSPDLLFDWAERLVIPEGVLEPQRPVEANDGFLSFSSLGMDPRLIPIDAIGRSLQAALRRRGAQILEYGDPAGLQTFRECLAHRMGQHGLRVGPEEILVTHGAQHALDLTLRGLARPGDRVLVEAPTYDKMLKLLAWHQVTPVAIPEDEHGLDLDALGRLIHAQKPVLLYTMPSFQNPSGRCLPQAQREGLLNLCERVRLPILEDGFEEDMKYFGRPMLPLKSMDRTGLVLYAGTFSKVLSPGLRLGWLAGSQSCLGPLTALRRTGDMGPSPLLQAGLEDFIEKGHLDHHLARLHRAFRRRMETALAALRRELPPSLATWEAPTGGYLIWLALRGIPESLDLEKALSAFGIGVRQGHRFFAKPEPSQTFLRLSISNLNETEITEGMARLGAGLRALQQQGSGKP